MLSKSTTRKPMLSKSLCHVQNHAFGLVSLSRYFHDFYSSDYCAQAPKSLYLQASYYSYSFTLDINTTVSTCLVCGNISTIFMHFKCIFMHFRFVHTCFIRIFCVLMHKYYVIIFIASRVR